MYILPTKLYVHIIDVVLCNVIDIAGYDNNSDYPLFAVKFGVGKWESARMTAALNKNRIAAVDIKFSPSGYTTLSDTAIFCIIKRAAVRRDSGNTANAFSESIEIRRMWLDFTHDRSSTVSAIDTP